MDEYDQLHLKSTYSLRVRSHSHNQLSNPSSNLIWKNVAHLVATLAWLIRTQVANRSASCSIRFYFLFSVGMFQSCFARCSYWTCGKSTDASPDGFAHAYGAPGLKIRSASNLLFHTSTSGSFSAVSTPIFASKYSFFSIVSRSTRCAFFCTAPISAV